MRNKVIKRIGLICIIVIVSIIILGITNKSQAVVDVVENPDYWKPNDQQTSTEFENKAGIILGVVSIIGVFVSVATLSVIGIKFMIGSVEAKAQYKQTLLPWGIGAVLIFSVTTIPTIIYNSTNGINEVSPVEISINAVDVLLKMGEYEEYTLKATVVPDTGGKITWLSSDHRIATVDSNGKVKARSAGTATITAISGKGAASCKVTVVAPNTTSIAISESSININQYTPKTYKLTATLTPANSLDRITWTSSNDSVATVENGEVKTVGAGIAVITATSGTKSATCTVKVEGERVYEGRYYNLSTNKVSSTWTSDEDLQFLMYTPDIATVRNRDKLPLIVFLHGFGEVRIYP